LTEKYLSPSDAWIRFVLTELKVSLINVRKTSILPRPTPVPVPPGKPSRVQAESCQALAELVADLACDDISLLSSNYQQGGHQRAKLVEREPSA
jgi:hypothetical protein